MFVKTALAAAPNREYIKHYVESTKDERTHFVYPNWPSERVTNLIILTLDLNFDFCEESDPLFDYKQRRQKKLEERIANEQARVSHIQLYHKLTNTEGQRIRTTPHDTVINFRRGALRKHTLYLISTCVPFH
jgi:hypothetical protein